MLLNDEFSTRSWLASEKCQKLQHCDLQLALLDGLLDRTSVALHNCVLTDFKLVFATLFASIRTDPLLGPFLTETGSEDDGLLDLSDDDFFESGSSSDDADDEWTDKSARY